MEMSDDAIKQIWGTGRRNTADVISRNCPGDKTLSLYAAGQLGGPEREKVESHLAVCTYCLDVILLYMRTGDEETSTEFRDASVSWKENAKKLFVKLREGKTSLLDIIVKVTREAIEVISNPGNLAITYGGLPGTVRSGNKILSPNLIILSKVFSDVESEVEVERIDDRHVNMSIRTVNVYSKAPAKVVRVSLLNPVRELASYITENGEVSFGNLNYGEYVIKIIRDREEIGHISLNITLNEN